MSRLKWLGRDLEALPGEELAYVKHTIRDIFDRLGPEHRQGYADDLAEIEAEQARRVTA